MKYKVPISIIMPVHNGERYLRQAVESALKQTLTNYELIIVNDGSTDTTEEIIKDFRDSRMIYTKVDFSNNYKARNWGMSMARGKYICMMDADDISLPNRLKEQFAFLETHRHISILGSHLDVINEEGLSVGTIKRPKKHSLIKTFLLKDNYIPQPTLMFRSHVYKKHGICYNANFAFAGDYEFIVRSGQSFRMENLDMPLVQYRRHSEQISSRKYIEQALLADKVREVQLHFFAIPFSKEERDLHLKLMKGQYIRDNDLFKAQEWLNRLLDANYKKRLYLQEHLYNFFENIFVTALNINNLGGWAIDKEVLCYVQQHFKKGGHILEFGSGKGTEALLYNFKVTSLEHDKDFFYKRGKKHHIVYAPITNGWYNRETVKEILKQNFDLIIIDGPPGKLRKGLTMNTDLFKNLSTPVLFDDIDRRLDKTIMEDFCAKIEYEYILFHTKSKMFAICRHIPK